MKVPPLRDLSAKMAWVNRHDDDGKGSTMRITRIYANNYRCLQKFEIALGETSSCILLGRNGVGKSAVRAVLELFKRIGCGENAVEDLLGVNDCTFSNWAEPVRFELECLIKNSAYSYTVAFDRPDGFHKARVMEERLSVDGKNVYRREFGQVYMSRSGDDDGEIKFLLDWHSVALPIVQMRGSDNPLDTFTQALRSMLLLAPVSPLIGAEANDKDVNLKVDCSNFASWFSDLLKEFPESITEVKKRLQAALPDFRSVRSEKIGVGSRRLVVAFQRDAQTFELGFDRLSDGEKCLFVSAVVIACNMFRGSTVCFWDEPDNYLAVSEVKPFVTELKQSFCATQGQLIVTSHNIEAVTAFTAEQSVVLYRNSHLEPVRTRALKDLVGDGKDFDLPYKLISGDLYDVE